MSKEILSIKAWAGAKQLPLREMEWDGVLGKEASLFLNTKQMKTILQRDFDNRSWDFMRIAAAVYAADRNTKRPAKRGNDSWLRRIRIEFPVKEPDFWNSNTTKRLMSDALSFLTGDDWSFKFNATQNCSHQASLQFGSRKQAKYFLYSGGLDSAAGLVKYAHEQPNDSVYPLLIGHRTNMSSKVNKQVERIRFIFPNVQPAIDVPFRMSKPLSEERSQRSRNFLFLVIAGVAAGKHVGDSVLVGENGVGAINMPLSTLMISTMATRGTHPTFLGKMAALSSHVLGRRLDYSLPHLHRTKGELVGALKEHDLADIAALTFSCSHPLHVKIADQCGQCPACIFRRHSLWIAGITDPGDRYQHRLFDTESTALTSDAKEAMCNFLEMIDRVEESGKQDTIDWIANHCEATGMTATPSVYELFKRYRLEWLAFCEAAQRERWSWGGFQMPSRNESP